MLAPDVDIDAPEPPPGTAVAGPRTALHGGPEHDPTRADDALVGQRLHGYVVLSRIASGATGTSATRVPAGTVGHMLSPLRRRQTRPCLASPSRTSAHNAGARRASPSVSRMTGRAKCARFIASP